MGSGFCQTSYFLLLFSLFSYFFLLVLFFLFLFSSSSLFFKLYSASYTSTTPPRCIVWCNAILCQTTNEQTSSPRPPFQLEVSFYFNFDHQQPPSTIPSSPVAQVVYRHHITSIPSFPALIATVIPTNPIACISAHSVLLTQGISQPVHLLFLHFSSHPCSQFRFFWPSEAPGCVFLSQTINSSPKKINALKRKLGAFLTK